MNDSWYHCNWLNQLHASLFCWMLNVGCQYKIPRMDQGHTWWCLTWSWLKCRWCTWPAALPSAAFGAIQVLPSLPFKRCLWCPSKPSMALQASQRFCATFCGCIYACHHFSATCRKKHLAKLRSALYIGCELGRMYKCKCCQMHLLSGSLAGWQPLLTSKVQAGNSIFVVIWCKSSAYYVKHACCLCGMMPHNISTHVLQCLSGQMTQYIHAWGLTTQWSAWQSGYVHYGTHFWSVHEVSANIYLLAELLLSSTPIRGCQNPKWQSPCWTAAQGINVASHIAMHQI